MNRNQLYRRIVFLLVHGRILYHPDAMFHESYGCTNMQYVADIFKHQDKYTIVDAKYNHIWIRKYVK